MINYIIHNQQIKEIFHNKKGINMDDNFIEEFNKYISLSKLEVSPDDVVMISVEPYIYKFDRLQQMYENVKKIFPNNKIIVKFKDMEINLVKEDKTNEN